MTQENKELLLKDLLGRIPYGLKLKIGDYSDYTLVGIIISDEHPIKIEVTERGVNYKVEVSPDIIKPYLRPISSMTEEEMDNLFDILRIDKDGKDEDWIKINDVLGIKFFFPSGKFSEDVIKAYDYLNSIHIDYRRLIEMDLAIEVTEENNPYETRRKKND